MPFSIMAPTQEQEDQFRWRGFSLKDIPDIYQLFQSVNQVDNKDHSESTQDMEQQFEDAWSDPKRDARTIRTLAGKLAAFLRVYVNPKPKGECVAFLVCEVAPEARGQGLEQQTLDWMESHAEECLAEVAQANPADMLPRLIRTSMPQTDAASIAHCESRGFRHVRSFFKMERDLHEPIPDKPLPAGLTLRTYGQDIDEPLCQAFNEAFADHWGDQEVPPEEWHPFVMDVSDVRRDLTLVVMDGDEVVAFSLNSVKRVENQRLGIKRGWIGNLGTRRAWRGRGVGSALLAESMRRFQAEGLDRAGLGVDAENLTGALALYERVGFHSIKTQIVMEKRVG